MGLRLICVGIAMVVGIFVGEILGVGYGLVGWLEGAQRVDIVGLVVMMIGWFVLWLDCGGWIEN